MAWRGKVVVFLGVAAALAAAALWLASALVERAVVRDAERRSLAWAEHAAVRLERIEEMAAGAPPRPGDWRAIEEMARFGDLFRFKLFSPEGVLRFESDDPSAAGASLGEHNATAAAVVETSRPFTVVADGREKPNRPDLYSETYLPVIHDGRLVAIVETYFDQTETRAAIRGEYALFGVVVLILTGLAFAGPGLALAAVLRRLRARNAELDVERDRALAADRAKSEFLTTVSHELRTPMNGVLGVAQILETTPLDEDQTELVGVLKASAEGQMALIEELLTFGEVEAGALHLSEEAARLPALLGEAMAPARAAASTKGLRLGLAVPEGAPAIVTDPRRLRQVVVNLVGNAVKFTDEGSVEVSADLEPRGEDGAWLRIAVTDTGPGIAPEEHARVFERFHQVDGSIRRKGGGTGLGLAISRAIAREMGGEIALQSAPGEGSTFTLSVPVRLAQEERADGAPLEAAA